MSTAYPAEVHSVGSPKFVHCDVHDEDGPPWITTTSGRSCGGRSGGRAISPSISRPSVELHSSRDHSGNA